MLNMIGMLINVAAGVALYFGAHLTGTPKIVAVSFFLTIAVLNTFVFGVFILGWSFLMSPSYAEEQKPGSSYYPGAKECIRMFDVSVKIADSFKGLRFWLSFAGSFVLMVGLMQQGWMLVLALEVFSSACGYGFISWVQKNRDRMHRRAYTSLEVE